MLCLHVHAKHVGPMQLSRLWAAHMLGKPFQRLLQCTPWEGRAHGADVLWKMWAKTDDVEIQKYTYHCNEAAEAYKAPYGWPQDIMA